MSSATSINRTDAERRRTGADTASTAGSPSRSDDTLQPWHFFVLASLMAATAAVVMARQATPEHLVLISLTIGAAGFAAAALYRTLAPLSVPTWRRRREPLSDACAPCSNARSS